MSTDLKKSTSTIKHSAELEEMKKEFEANGWQLEGESDIHIAYSYDLRALWKRQQEQKAAAQPKDLITLEELAKELEANAWKRGSSSPIHIAHSYDLRASRKRQQEAAQSAADSNSNS